MPVAGLARSRSYRFLLFAWIFSLGERWWVRRRVKSAASFDFYGARPSLLLSHRSAIFADVTSSRDNGAVVPRQCVKLINLHVHGKKHGHFKSSSRGSEEEAVPTLLSFKRFPSIDRYFFRSENRGSIVGRTIGGQ